jgi:hypothetical protein
VGTWGTFSGDMAAGAWRWPPPSSAEVKNAWSDTSTSPYAFVASSLRSAYLKTGIILPYHCLLSWKNFFPFTLSVWFRVPVKLHIGHWTGKFSWTWKGCIHVKEKYWIIYDWNIDSKEISIARLGLGSNPEFCYTGSCSPSGWKRLSYHLE